MLVIEQSHETHVSDILFHGHFAQKVHTLEYILPFHT